MQRNVQAAVWSPHPALECTGLSLGSTSSSSPANSQCTHWETEVKVQVIGPLLPRGDRVNSRLLASAQHSPGFSDYISKWKISLRLFLQKIKQGVPGERRRITLVSGLQTRRNTGQKYPSLLFQITSADQTFSLNRSFLTSIFSSLDWGEVRTFSCQGLLGYMYHSRATQNQQLKNLSAIQLLNFKSCL